VNLIYASLFRQKQAVTKHAYKKNKHKCTAREITQYQQRDFAYIMAIG